VPSEAHKCHGNIFNRIIPNDLSQFLGVFAYLFFIVEVPESGAEGTLSIVYNICIHA
jgi:hypothetical protein